MDDKLPDNERLRDVCDGYELLTAQELAALIPEMVREGFIQRVVASAVMVKRLIVVEEATGPTAEVIPFKAKQPKPRR